MVYFDKKIPRKMCEAIDEIGDENGMRLARRPWNRFKATTSSWWLVPSSKQPHHQYGKYFFDWGDKDFDSIIAGLYVEKGLDKALRSVYPAKKGAVLIMRENWAWPKLADDMASGKFKEIIEALPEMSCGLEFHVEGGYVDDPYLYDPQDSNLQNDHYTLEFNQNTGQAKVAKAVRKSMQLKALNKVKDLRSLIDILLEFDRDQWLWVNFMVAIRLQAPFNHEIPEGAEVWNSQTIWNNFLSHLQNWVV
jgi:hypothetical protein